ncbi:CocE/NonD family hydrolase [Nocardia huaxiensis]|uniref:CocE/NonD family hydrolase n=1 Tax=Nocardia huaxiensis TaxID=2755382 RepID=UPI001E6166DD|nr:CocE/NonD family hydrolase [Nocardia huaxiensis]UFS95881.1 CocE/NonD family hydrolase [Nocardia huaxiensis]
MRSGIFMRGKAIRGLTAAVVLTVGALVAVPSASGETGTGFTGIDGDGYAANWTAAVDGPQPYSGVVPDLAVPITMSDGTVLKADIIHPAQGGRMADGQRPVILQMQGYGKLPVLIGQSLLYAADELGIKQPLENWIGSLNLPGIGLDGLFDMTRQADSGAIEAALQDFALAEAGYTLVQVDLRGTGTSEGAWQVFGDREKRDTAEVIDWITRQGWSDGTVGAMGISFTAITALQATAYQPPGLKAVFAYEGSADIFNDIAGAGGAVGVGFLIPWLLGVNALKMIPDITALIAGRFDPAQQVKWLQDRIANPATLVEMVLNGYTALTPDQLTAYTRQLVDPDSGFRQGLQTDVSKIEVPTFMVGSWFDIFGTTPTDTFDAIPLSREQKKLIMGDGYHLGTGVAGFGHAGMPPRLDVLQRAWFDHWLRGIDNGIEKYSPLVMKQQGGGWTDVPDFPRTEATYRRMYLNDLPSGTSPTSRYDGGLSHTALQAGVRDLTVAPGLLSLCGRDTARISAGVTSIIEACGNDSRIWEHDGLSFTSSPVAEPTTISGPINVHLNAVHDAADGYWVATVNDVAPDGSSREISTGQLVSSVRQIDDETSLRSPNGDYTEPRYYLDIERREQTVPGVPVTLDIALTPIEAVLQPGHRLRVDVYASNFPKGLPPLMFLADSGLRPQHLRLDPDAPSWVNIALTAAIPE